ncbi:hypothetical protein BDR05DRAFT_960974, partial [Suillus weaverae]
SLFLLDDGCVTIFLSLFPLNFSSSLSSDSSRSFYWMTDASPSSVPFLFPLNISPSLSSNSSRSFYWMTDASPSSVLFPLTQAYLTPSYTLFTFLSPHIYRPTQVTPSYTLFTIVFVLRDLSLLQASRPPARSCTLPAPIRAPRFARSSIPSLLTFYDFTTSYDFTTFYDFLRLFTTFYDFFSAPDAERASTHLRALWSTHSSIPAYSMIMTFSLPARTPEGPAPIRAHYVHAAYSIQSTLWFVYISLRLFMPYDIL